MLTDVDAVANIYFAFN